MSQINTWMPLYVGDYLADTMHLDTREHGAYLLMMMHYWRTGPLPENDKLLAGIVKLDQRTWVKDVAPTLRAFFTVKDGRLHQKRMDQELADAEAICAKRAKAANARWGKNGDKVTPGGDAGASEDPKGASEDAKEAICTSPSPSPSPLTSRRSVKSTLVQFDRFWKEYPRRQGRGAAEKAWSKAVLAATPDEIFAGLIGKSWPDDPQFIPMPATWLNQKRWLDEAATAKNPPPDPSAPPATPSGWF